jgi:hypothetical protein
MDDPGESGSEKSAILGGLAIFVALLLMIGGAVYLWKPRSAFPVATHAQLPTVATSMPAAQPAQPRDSPGTLVGYRGRNGESILFNVTGTAGHTIWGTDVYTDDSPLAVAVVHAGALQVGERGVVRVTILPGKARYEASTRNGITSAPYEKWEGSYQLERVRGTTTQPVIDMPAPRAPARDLARVTETPATRRAVGETYMVEVVGETGGNVWGTDVYTDDSSIAAAAVHAGLLAPGERGNLRVTVRQGQSAYQGSVRNGVISRDYASWGGSFSLQRLDGL